MGKILSEVGRISKICSKVNVRKIKNKYRYIIMCTVYSVTAKLEK